MTELEIAMYIVLKNVPDRCRLVGGERWHLQAQKTIETQCSVCKCIDEFELQNGGPYVPS